MNNDAFRLTYQENNMAASRIIHLALNVDSLDYAIRFYEQVFGFKHIET